MNMILKLSDEDRQIIFRNTAQKMGVHEAIIEKDYWVCLVLDYLFHKSCYQNHLTFKGGTSLSKCYDLINRFSEDIDLILDWRLLGYEKNEPWQERSNTKQDYFNKEANTKAEIFLSNEFMPDFITGMSNFIGRQVKAEIEKADPQTVRFIYPRLFNADSILQSIRLEIGALAAWMPAVKRTVTPYIFGYYPDLTEIASTTVITSSPERTFWEKATILHHEANRPEHLEMPARYSRHYYDLYCFAKSEHKMTALKRYDLLNKVVAFKMKFYPRAWAKYPEAVPGTIRLIPPSYRLDALREDYKAMTDMFFSDYPSYDELIEGIIELENEINHK